MAKKITAEIAEKIRFMHSKGLNNREIADMLNIDASTASRHVRGVYDRKRDSKEVSDPVNPGDQMELLYNEPDPEKIRGIAEEILRTLVREKLPDIVRDEIRNATISIQFNF